MRPTTDLQRTVAPFRVVADFEPSGDQPTAIADLTKRIKAGEQDIVLLGATGTGKSATTRNGATVRWRSVVGRMAQP